MNESTSRLPTSKLRPYISHYAGCKFENLEPGVTRGLPSRHISLLISLEKSFELPGSGSFDSFIAGLDAKPALVKRTESVHCIHIFLNPLGIRTIFGFTAAAISGEIVQLQDVFGYRSDELIDRLKAMSSWESRFDLIDQTFLNIYRPTESRPELDWSWKQLLRTGGRCRIGDLADSTGWSRRHLCERFKQEFGISPKTAARILKFQHACTLLKNTTTTLAQTAAAAGYYDQAHLSHEWRALAGCSPKQWLVEEFPFLQDYEVKDIYD